MAVQLDSRSFSSTAQRMMAAQRPTVQAGGGLSKPAVVSMPSPNHNDRPAGTDIDTIVLHHTASGGQAQDTGRFFQNPASQVSSHYIVGKDGTIVQSVADNKRAWHAGESTFKGKGDVNDFSLGIEIVNKGDNRDAYTDAQYEALIKLVAYLCQTYKVPMDRITGHRDVAIPRGRKTDPSDNFDWSRVRAGVQKLLNGQQAPAPKPDPKPDPKPQPAPQPAPQPVRDTVQISPDARAQVVPPVSSRDIQPVVAGDIQPFTPPPDRPAQPAVAYAPQVPQAYYPAPAYPMYQPAPLAYGTPTPLGSIGTTPGYPLPMVQPAAYAYQTPAVPYAYQAPTGYPYGPYQQAYAYPAPYAYQQQPVSYAAYQPYVYPQPGYGYVQPGYGYAAPVA